MVFEATGKHLIGLVETEYLDSIGAEGVVVDHVIHTTGSTDDDMDPLMQTIRRGGSKEEGAGGGRLCGNGSTWDGGAGDCAM